MEARSHRMVTRLMAALAFALVALMVVFAHCNGADPGKLARDPRAQQTGRLVYWPKVVAMSSSSGGGKGFRGKGEETSADGGVTSARAEMVRCSFGTLLGGWEGNTYVPLPYDALAPFLAEARGVLSRAERDFFVGRRDGVDVAPKYLPVNSLVGLTSAPPPEDESLSFLPPCYYHFYNKQEIVQLFAGKWMYFFGDSNTRGLILGLLATLDPTHRAPYSDAIWFNGTKQEVNWPHVNSIHYFFKEDGSIPFKTGRGSKDHLPPFPESGYSFRLSYTMTHDIEFLIETTKEVLGEGDWAPDVLHFSSGAWDSAALNQHPDEWNLARVNRGYGQLLDSIAHKCNPKRQVCFWGTIGSLQQVDSAWWDGLAVLQWRHVARIAARQMDAGNASTLHALDRYWIAFNRLDQNFGGHMTTAINAWLPQVMMNAYHSVAEERGLLANPLPLAQPSRSYCAEEVGCVLLPGGIEGRKVKCESYPLRVDFEDGCTIDKETDVPNVGDQHIMWARSCRPQVIV